MVMVEKRNELKDALHVVIWITSPKIAQAQEEILIVRIFPLSIETVSLSYAFNLS